MGDKWRSREKRQPDSGSDEFLAGTDNRRLMEGLTACEEQPHCPLPLQSKRSCVPQWGPHPVPRWWPPCLGKVGKFVIFQLPYLASWSAFPNHTDLFKLDILKICLLTSCQAPDKQTACHLSVVFQTTWKLCLHIKKKSLSFAGSCFSLVCFKLYYFLSFDTLC